MRCFFGAGVLVVAVAGAVTAATPSSGLRPGEEVSAWEPVHVAGPLEGTRTCPVCTFLDAPVILVFARDVSAAVPLVKPLEDIARSHSGGKLKVVLVVVNGAPDQVKSLARICPLRHLMLCCPDPERRDRQLRAYKIDPAVSNTVMLYRDYTVLRSWTGMGLSDFPGLVASAAPFLPKQ